MAAPLCPAKNGIIVYTLSRLGTEEFRRCFMSWFNDITVKTEGEVIATDGKTSRGSKDAKNAQSPLHLGMR